MSSRSHIEPRRPLLNHYGRRRNEDRENSVCSESAKIIVCFLMGSGVLAFAVSIIIYVTGLGEVIESSTTSSGPETANPAPYSIPTAPPTRERVITTVEPTTSTTTTTTTTTETTAGGNKMSSLDCGKRIIGYYSEKESTEITRLQLLKLTHAVFAYAKMKNDGSISIKNNQVQRRFTNLKNKSRGIRSDLKLMISIGGHENSEFFSPVIADPVKRKTFINSVHSFLQDQHLDGVDLFWKWPKESESSEYVEFLSDLRSALDGHDYIISITASQAGMDYLESGFEMNEIIKHVDFVNVLSMDYYGPWPNVWGTPTGPISPLYSGVREKKNFNVDYTMEYYTCETKQSQKFNIVIPFFVRRWKNVEEALDPGSEVFRRVQLKEDKAEGDIYVVRWTIEHEKWNITNSSWDENSKSSYIYNRDMKQFTVFETPKSIEAKMNYVNEMNLGGVWIWSVDMDDEKNNLLKAVVADRECTKYDQYVVRYYC